MSSDRRSREPILKERIRLLQAENDILNERAEDVMLLGLVAENITPLRDNDEIIKTLLERISILYEIPYCGFALLNGKACEFNHEFRPHVERVKGSSLELRSSSIKELENGALTFSADEASTKGVELHLEDVDPIQIVLIPCRCTSKLRGVFVFADDSDDSDFLLRKLIVLQQVTGLASARMENIHLLDELQRLNSDLEIRVKKRTAELNRSALALETEVAERRRVEEVIAGERHRLHSVVEHIPEGIIVLDEDRRIVLANRATATAEPLIGAAVPGARLETIASRPLADFESGASESGWVEVETSSEPSMVFEVAVRRFGSHIPGSIIVLRDTSDQRKVADQLLQQERLAAMGHLAAGIAHDFNNLIQAVTILAESLLLNDEEDPESRKAKTREILALGERAAALIRQILDYSRQTVTRPQPVDLRNFVTKTLTMLDRLIPETVRIEITSAPGDHTVRIDPVQLQQVLTNLILNSSQAMPRGGEIRVHLLSSKTGPNSARPYLEIEEGNWVWLSIADTGCGIPLKVQPRIFEPFFTTKERGRGTGLGLAQTYGIVRQNHGHIFFESEPDRGTTFTIVLPVDDEEAEITDPVPDLPAPPQGEDELILVVEDDPTVRELTADLLQILGYRPICASDGLEALEFLGSTQEDIRLVLSDVTMPRMGGAELAVELQRRHPELPIVLMSGYAPDPIGGSFSSKNLAAWLQKPFSVEHLASTLALVLSKNPRVEADPS